MQKLELISNNLIKWFEDNHMKVNTDQVTKIPSFLLKVMFFTLQKEKPKVKMYSRKVNFMDLAKRKDNMKTLKRFITSQSNENIFNIPA